VAAIADLPLAGKQVGAPEILDGERAAIPRGRPEIGDYRACVPIVDYRGAITPVLSRPAIVLPELLCGGASGQQQNQAAERGQTVKRPHDFGASQS
jgi:hypothetical protein